MCSLQLQNGNTLDGSATFDAIAQHESKKALTPAKTVDSNFKINTSNGNFMTYFLLYIMFARQFVMNLYY